MMSHIEAARMCLEELRKGTPRAQTIAESLRQHALAARISLGDIGTDVDELDALIKNGTKVRAMIFLRTLREEGRDIADFIPMIRECIAEAGCTLADIGTSEEELAKYSSLS